MNPRTREALFRQMRRHGVTQYTEGDVSVTVGDLAPVVQAAAPKEEEDELELPEGVMDPRLKLAEIYKRKKKAA